MGSRAVIIVSGGGSVSPFTTPMAGGSSDDGFLSAGNTDTALREYLLDKGLNVFTAPVHDQWGPVREPDPASFGPFKDAPGTLSDSMTILSTGDIDNAGEKLHRFLRFLCDRYEISEIDLIGHSNGGLYARSAIRLLKQTGSSIKVRSLITLGTPHCGSVPGRMTIGELTSLDTRGDMFSEKLLELWPKYALDNDKGLNIQDTEHYLMGDDGWNAAQGRALEGIPVTLLAGTWFTSDGEGNPTMWPYDGLVSQHSAWATGIPEEIMPIRNFWTGHLTHSIFVSDAIGADWQTALTWNAEALARVAEAISEA